MKSKREIKKMLVKSSSSVLKYLEESINENEDKATFNLVIIIKSELSEVKRLNAAGTISYDEYARALSKIRLNILNVIEEIPDSYFTQIEKQKSYPTVSLQNETVFLEVFSLIRDLANIRIQELECQNGPNFEAISSHMNTQRHITVNQVIKLSEINHITLSSVEYRIIAEAFQSVYDNVKAIEYFKKAIDTIDEYTDSTNSKIVAIRSYAGFLYVINKADEGAKQYETAILQNTNDEGNNFNGYTYQMQFMNEADVGNYETAVKAYVKSKAYFLKIGNLYIRNQNIKSLQNSWDLKRLPPSFLRP